VHGLILGNCRLTIGNWIGEKMTDLRNGFLKAISGVIPASLRYKTGSILKWVAVGCAIRLALMPIFAHPDLAATIWVSLTWITKNQIIISQDPAAVFFFLGNFYRLIMPIFPSPFVNFLNAGISYTPQSTLIIYGLLQPGVRTAIFIAKLPFLLLDVSSAFIILHLFDDGQKAFRALKLWILNPVVLYVSYIFGQYDIFAVFFIFVSLFFLRKKKFAWSMVALGFACAFKIIGVALMPLVVIYFLKTKKFANLGTKIFRLGSIVLLGLLPLIFFTIVYSQTPTYYESVNFVLPQGAHWAFNGFFGHTFYSRGVPVTSPLFSGVFAYLLDFSISFRNYQLPTDIIYLVPLVYGLILLAALYTKDMSFEKVCGYFAAFLLTYYAFSLFLPQWFLWIQPFLIILAVNNRKVFQKLYVLMLFLYFLYIWQWDAGLTTNLIAPLFPQAVFWPGPLALIDATGFNRYQIVGLFVTMFSATCLFTIFCIYRYLTQNDSKIVAAPTIEDPIEKSKQKAEILKRWFSFRVNIKRRRKDSETMVNLQKGN
jgi:hypothetical protein